MIDLINKVIFDFKKNFKPFIIIYIVFITFFYLNEIWKPKAVYNYNSSLLFTEPSSISNWAQFDEAFFKQSLYLYVSNLNTNVLIKENCSIDTKAEHIIDTNFVDNKFRYTMINFTHADEVSEQCMSEIYKNVILTFYNDFLQRAIDDNKMISEYLKTKTLVTNTNLFMSTFKESFRGPRLVSNKFNISLKFNMNFSKIIIIAFIFSAILSIFITSLYDNKTLQTTLKKYKDSKK